MNVSSNMLDKCTEPGFDKPWPLVDYEKFAELIVQECAKIAMDNDPSDTGISSDAIKRHFGVK